MLVFTSCTNNYIPKARVLASSLKFFHPDWEFCLLLGETPPEGFDIEEEPFDRYLTFDQINIPEYKGWLFRHRVVEICTAAKGPALQYFVETEGHDKVIYLDPDIMVINELTELSDLLNEHDILLTPHQLAPQTTLHGIEDNEISSLKHGVYNLGFVAIAHREQGIQFARWWRDRLYHFCYDDIPNGLFTDQRWCDLAPAFFSKLYIIRNPGYNAASWNLTDRSIIRLNSGIFMTNDVPLRFYHFTGYDSGAGKVMTSIYGKYMPAVAELWSLYEQRLLSFNHKILKKCKWQYITLEDCTPITDEMRYAYRKHKDVQQAFPDPFKVNQGICFLNWFLHEYIGKNNYQHKHSLSSERICRCKTWIKELIQQVFIYTQKKIIVPLFLKCCKIQKNVENVENVEILQHESKDLSLEMILYGETPSSKSMRDELFTTILAEKKRPVCMIDHKYGGGANAYRSSCIKEYIDENRSVLLISWDIHTHKIHAIAQDGTNQINFVAENIDEFYDIHFATLSLIFINELVLWSKGEKNNTEAIPEILLEIKKLAEKHHAELQFAYHDHFSICPNYNLIGEQSIFCNLPQDKKICSLCLEKMDPLYGDIPTGFSLEKWRAAWQNLFRSCKEIRFFSNASLQMAKRCFSFCEDQIHILPHAPMITWNTIYAVPVDGPMVIAVIGNISVAKGALIIQKLATILNDEQRLVVIGVVDDTVQMPSNTVLTGAYRREDLPSLFERYRVTVGFVPSVCPETFNYVTQECMTLGLPMVCFDVGAPAERIGIWEYGLVAKEMTSECALKTLENLDARRRQDSCSSHSQNTNLI